MTIEADARDAVSASPRAGSGESGSRIVTLVVACAMFMETMDTTILAIALPAIARDLSVDPISLKLAVTSYLVGLAIFIPISGWVADRLGAATTFRIALAVFMVASTGCAFSTTLHEFVFWRFIQGLGGAMMSPVGRMVIIRMIPKAELVRAFAFIATPSMIGPMLGPPLGGLIVTYASWPWIFIVNIPIGLLGIWLATLYMTDEKGERTPLDLEGLVLCAVALSGLVLGAAVGGRHIAPPVVAVTLVAIGLAASLHYVWHSTRVDHPVLDLRYLGKTTYSAGVIGGIFFRMSVGASMFLLPLMLQLGFGFSALTAGLVSIAVAGGALCAKPFAVHLLRRIGFRGLLFWNALFNALATIATGMIGPAWPLAVIFAFLFLTGIVRSLQFTSLNAISFADIGGRDVTPATSVANVSQQISVSIGVAIGALALEIAMIVNGHETPAVGDFTVAFGVIGVMSALSVLWLVRLPPGAGAEMSGHGVR